jgi:hypothetical protein
MAFREAIDLTHLFVWWMWAIWYSRASTTSQRWQRLEQYGSVTASFGC